MLIYDFMHDFCTETHFGFAEKMYNITEGESVKVCVRVIVSDEEIGNEKFNLKVVVQNDNQEYILPGANLASELLSVIICSREFINKPAYLLQYSL